MSALSGGISATCFLMFSITYGDNKYRKYVDENKDGSVLGAQLCFPPPWSLILHHNKLAPEAPWEAPILGTRSWVPKAVAPGTPGGSLTGQCLSGRIWVYPGHTC